MEKEIWKSVNGFEGRYEISNFGRLKSIGGKWKETKIIIPNKTDSGGYYSVSLRSVKHGIKRKCIRIHQLVAEHFLEKPNINERLEIDHIDSNTINNNVNNLRWLTVLQHRKITIDKGEHDLKGEKHPHAKLTTSNVLEMRELYKSGRYTQKQLGLMFNICKRHASDIINRKNWAWL